MQSLTAAHITHEAAEKIGGIGAVLEGILTSPVYQRHVHRSILVGPFAGHVDVALAQRLGPDSRVLYSTLDRLDERSLAGAFAPIERMFNVNLIYGEKTFTLPGSEHHAGRAEILLIDVFNISREHVSQFKRRLWETFEIDSLRYESDWGYEEYVRLAEPAFYALLALLSPPPTPTHNSSTTFTQPASSQRHIQPCVLFAHEFMGLPTAYKAVLDDQAGGDKFRTIFHAHECGTARAIVESHAGHDIAFYNILEQAREQSLYVEDIFGDRSASFRHALVSRAHLCDAIIAVGDYTAQEMHFLGDHFDHHHIDLVYNGVPHLTVSAEMETASRRKLDEYAQALLGFTPDILMTHVTRPVVSKGLWRDVLVCDALEEHLEAINKTAALFIVTSAGGTRRPHDAALMAAEYHWPRRHRQGYPDLVGPEVAINTMVESFNAQHRRVQIALVNQFGWSSELLGVSAPADMTFADLRRAADVELGMAVYEPFGISPLEPLASGAVCVISNVCGCAGFVNAATEHEGGGGIPNVLIADFTRLDQPRTIEQLLAMTQAEREDLERSVADHVARELMSRLPFNDAARRALLDAGQSIITRLGWDHVLETSLIPMLRRIVNEG